MHRRLSHTNRTLFLQHHHAPTSLHLLALGIVHLRTQVALIPPDVHLILDRKRHAIQVSQRLPVFPPLRALFRRPPHNLYLRIHKSRRMRRALIYISANQRQQRFYDRNRGRAPLFISFVKIIDRVKELPWFPDLLFFTVLDDCCLCWRPVLLLFISFVVDTNHSRSEPRFDIIENPQFPQFSKPRVRV
jgi:hypothetical protein